MQMGDIVSGNRLSYQNLPKKKDIFKIVHLSDHTLFLRTFCNGVKLNIL